MKPPRVVTVCASTAKPCRFPTISSSNRSMAIRFGTQDVLGDGGSFRPGATVNTGHPLHDEFLS